MTQRDQRDRWETDFHQFIEQLQLAAVIRRSAEQRRRFCAQFAKELAFVALYLDALDVTGGDAPLHPDPPLHCDLCNVLISKQGFFVDGGTKDGSAADMCPHCYAEQGIGIGWGIGQLYRQGA